MSHEVHRRCVQLSDLSVNLTGVSPATAREVAALLPAAVAAEIGRPVPTETGPQSESSATAVTARLAREIAGRIQGVLAEREGR